VELVMLKGMFLFEMGQYGEAASQFNSTLALKKLTLPSVRDDEMEEEVKEKHVFVSQMQYNRAVCHLMMGELLAAVLLLEQCTAEVHPRTQSRLMELISILKSKKNDKKSIEIFPQRNKLSRLLN
jgi:hypothetical protein